MGFLLLYNILIKYFQNLSEKQCVKNTKRTIGLQHYAADNQRGSNSLYSIYSFITAKLTLKIYFLVPAFLTYTGLFSVKLGY